MDEKLQTYDAQLKLLRAYKNAKVLNMSDEISDNIRRNILEIGRAHV